jgi:hypothetical protein
VVSPISGKSLGDCHAEEARRLGGWLVDFAPVAEFFALATECKDKPELNHTALILGMLKAAHRVVDYFRKYEELGAADLVTADKHEAILGDAKRLKHWLDHFTRRLEQLA